MLLAILHRSSQLAMGLASRAVFRRAMQLAISLLCIVASEASAQLPLKISADRRIASVGDTLHIRVLFAKGPLLPQDSSALYRFDADVEYIAQSTMADTQPLADGGEVQLSSNTWLVSLDDLGSVPDSLTFRVRVVGAIEEIVVHDGALVIDDTASQWFLPLGGVPTYVEDENAWLDESPVEADASISEASPSLNFGGSAVLSLFNGGANEDRVLLRFTEPGALFRADSDLIRGRVEAWATDWSVRSWNVRAQRIRSSWTEGNLDGAPCLLNGVTWTSPNCLLPWTGGGDLDNSVEGSQTLPSGERYLGVDVVDLSSQWIERQVANDGVALLLTGAVQGQSLQLQSAEDSGRGSPSPRFAVVQAPKGTYDQKAAERVEAEIVPNQVSPGAIGERFVYSMIVSTDVTHTGVNRVFVDVPSVFSLDSIDSVLVDGTPLSRDLDGKLGLFEYELWGSGNDIDLRLADGWKLGASWVRLDIVFRASAPQIEIPAGVEFVSTVDHDRRGYPVQSAQQGNANGSDEDDDKWLVRVEEPEISFLSVAPIDTFVALGDSVVYRAFAKYSDGQLVDVTTGANWSSTPGSVVVAGSKPWIARAVGQGSGQLWAEFDGVTSPPAHLQVGPPELRELGIDPPALGIAQGDVAQFSATGRFSDGSTVDLTGAANWSSSDEAVASSSGGGLFQGLSPGSVQIDAFVGPLTADSASLFVGPPELRDLTVSPADTTVALGRNAQLFAWGRFSDGSISDLSAVAIWESQPAGIIDIGADGSTTTLAEGETFVRASVDTVESSQARFVVSAAKLIELDGNPDSSAIPVGAQLQLSSIGTFSDGSEVDLTDTVQWLSLDTATASVSAQGEVLALAVGSARIAHEASGVFGDTLLVDVTPATIDSVVVMPNPIRVPTGVQLQLTAWAYLSDDSKLDVSDDSQWSVLDSSIADVDGQGVLSTMLEGVTEVQATWQSVPSQPCNLIVDDAALSALSISPADTTLALGLDFPARAWGLANGNVYELTSSVQWSTQNPGVATVDSSGVVTTNGVGTTLLDASFAAVSAPSATIQVETPTVLGLEITPMSAAVLLGRSKAFQAVASYSDGHVTDVSSLASWQGSVPSIFFVDGFGTGHALSIGAAQLTASFGGVDSSPANVVVLPSVRALALPTGQVESWPGEADQLAFGVRVTNHYLSQRRLNALRISLDAPPAAISTVSLYVDDGDGDFDAQADTLLVSGAPLNGLWTANGISVGFGVSQTRTFYASLMSNPDRVPHGTVLDAAVTQASEFFFDQPTAVVADDGFPLDGAGEVIVQDFVLNQMTLTASASDSIAPGAVTHEILRVVVPDDGHTADTLERVEIAQLGSARNGQEIQALRLLARDAGITEVGLNPPPVGELPNLPAYEELATLAFVGGNRYAAAFLDHPVPVGGLELVVVADVQPGAELGRTLQARLPADGIELDSGRRGPADGAWTNPGICEIAVVPELQLRRRPLPPVVPVSRGDRRLSILGLDLTPLVASIDSLTALEIEFVDLADGQPLPNNPEIALAELWLDADSDSRVSEPDELLATAAPQFARLRFESGPGWPLPLLPSQDLPLLVSVDPDSARVRDGDRFAARLADENWVESAGDVDVILIGDLVSEEQWVVDGQDLAGYDIADGPGGIAFAGSSGHLLLEFDVPSNGVDSDRLESVEFLNLGTAGAASLESLELWRDDGDGMQGLGDQLLGALMPAGGQSWRLTGLDEAIDFGEVARFRLLMNVADSPTVGGSVRMQLPLGGIQVASGNDGPIDETHSSADAINLAVGSYITWVAETLPGASVPPNQKNRALLVLTAFNGYNEARNLNSLAVQEIGGAAESEFDIWSLHLDSDGDGVLGPREAAAAVAVQSGGEIRFEGFNFALPALQQIRLFVAYNLSIGQARDGSTLDAVVVDEGAFGYAGPELTDSGADFPLNSPGGDVVDGSVAAQYAVQSITPLSLGGGEQGILAFDFIVPSNGFESDVLEELEIQLVGAPSVVLGEDVDALRLYRELDADPTGASFDPSEDILLASLLSDPGELRFSGFSAAIPQGGRRFYVVADIASDPNPERVLAMCIPLLGAEFASGNDGPVDVLVHAGVEHKISESELLLSVEAQPLIISVGQPVDLNLVTENRGDSNVTGVEVLGLVAPMGAAYISGPVPASLDLDADESGAFVYRYALSAPGQQRFEASVGLADSSLMSDPGVSPWITVESPPSELVMQPLSTLPFSVNRGITGLTPMVWQFEHPDSAITSAPIEIRSLAFAVQDDAGSWQSANTVFERVRLRAEGQDLAVLNPVGADSLLTLDLDPPLILEPAQTRSLPLEVDILADASASSFRLHLDGAWAVSAHDANSGNSIPVSSPLPWSTSSTLLRTVAENVLIGLSETLPPVANRGQSGVPAGRLSFELPGSPGESEARLTGLAVRLYRPDGAVIDPSALLDRVRVHSGAQELLDAVPAVDPNGVLRMNLSLPKVLSSGTPEDIDLLFDFSSTTSVDSLMVALADSAEYVVRDQNSGVSLAVLFDLVNGVGEQGPLVLSDPADVPSLIVLDRSPRTVAPASQDLALLQLDLEHVGSGSQAPIALESVRVRILDEQASALVPAEVVDVVELRVPGVGVVAAASLPTSPAPVELILPTPVLVDVAELASFEVYADLAGDIGVEWIRFAIEADGVTVVDGNEPARVLDPDASLPFATDLTQIVRPATAIAVGNAGDPPANVLRDAADALLLELVLVHPGEENETPIQPDSVLVRCHTREGALLDATGVFTGARLRLNDVIVAEGAVVPEGLRFDLSGLPELLPADQYVVQIHADGSGTDLPQYLRLGFAAGDWQANSQGAPVSIEPAASAELPYLSPTIHRLGEDVESTLSNYPNPFAAGRTNTHIAFVLPSPARVTVDVYTLDGQRVRTLLSDESLPEGLFDGLSWDGRNGDGDVVRNGVYLLRVDVSGEQGGRWLRKMAVAR